MFVKSIPIIVCIVMLLGGIGESISYVFAVDDPAPIDLQVYIPGVSTEKRECAIGDIGKACATDEECNKSVEGKTIKGRCVTKATATVDPDDKTGGVISYIGGIYKFLIGIAALASVFMIMIAGYRWLFAGGNSGAIDDAKTRIKGAVAGLAIALLSYSILHLINPELVSLKLENVPEPIKKVEQKTETTNEDIRENVEENLTKKCPDNINLAEPDGYKVSSSLSVCGSVYTIVNPTQAQKEQFPDGKCYGLTCFKGVKNGEYLSEKVQSTDKANTTTVACTAKTRTEGFECVENKLGAAMYNNASYEASKSSCATARTVAECEEISQTVTKATNAQYFCRLETFYKPGDPDPKYACKNSRFAVCPNGRLRLKCDGTAQIDKDVSLGRVTLPAYQFKGFTGPHNECNQPCNSEKYGTGGSTICCAITKDTGWSDIPLIKQNVINCRESECKPNEVAVDCDIFDGRGTEHSGNGAGPVRYQTTFRDGNPKPSLCKLGSDTKGVCCWQVDTYKP